MKRILNARQVRRIKFMCGTFMSLLMLAFLGDRVSAQISRQGYGGPYYWQGVEYAQFTRIKTDTGYVDEYTNRELFCRR